MSIDTPLLGIRTSYDFKVNSTLISPDDLIRSYRSNFEARLECRSNELVPTTLECRLVKHRTSTFESLDIDPYTSEAEPISGPDEVTRSSKFSKSRFWVHFHRQKPYEIRSYRVDDDTADVAISQMDVLSNAGCEATFDIEDNLPLKEEDDASPGYELINSERLWMKITGKILKIEKSCNMSTSIGLSNQPFAKDRLGLTDNQLKQSKIVSFNIF